MSKIEVFSNLAVNKKVIILIGRFSLLHYEKLLNDSEDTGHKML